jgi:hypothetical protein
VSLHHACLKAKTFWDAPGATIADTKLPGTTTFPYSPLFYLTAGADFAEKKLLW